MKYKSNAYVDQRNSQQPANSISLIQVEYMHQAYLNYKVSIPRKTWSGEQ